MAFHACFTDPRLDCEACGIEEMLALEAEREDEPDREPTAEQERAWDLREDDLRGHVLADAHEDWLGEPDPGADPLR